MKITLLLILSLIFISCKHLQSLSYYDRCILSNNDITVCELRAMQYEELKKKKDNPQN